MEGHILDSSALAKYYHTEDGSGEVERLVRLPNVMHLISRLSDVEIRSVFARKVRSGLISARDAAGLRRRFLEDISSGVFRVVALTNEHYESAGVLIERHGTNLGLRTLDSLQLAVALSLHRSNVAGCLVAADKVLCNAAHAEGMPVIDPELPSQ